MTNISKKNRIFFGTGGHLEFLAENEMIYLKKN